MGLKVHQDRCKQNRLEDWNEFRAFYYRKFKASKKGIEPAEQNLLPKIKEWEEAQARLTDAITDPDVIYSQYDEIRASEKEVAAARSRVESAENALRAAKSEKSKPPLERAGLLRTTQLELSSAQVKLGHAIGSEEMRRLRDGHALDNLHRIMLCAKGTLNEAQRQVKKWGIFLKWIDNQYSALAADCGYQSAVRRNHSSRVSNPSKGKSVSCPGKQQMHDIPPTTPIQQYPVEQQRLVMAARQPTSLDHTESHDHLDAGPDVDRRAALDGQKRRTRARAVLKPVRSGISKRIRQKRSPQRKNRDVPQGTENMTTDSGDPARSMSGVPIVQEVKPQRGREPPCSRPFRPQRMSKIARKQPKGEQSIAIKVQARASSRIQEQRQRHSSRTQRLTPTLVKTRSGRVSKRPDVFCPG